jgi:general secretion pathway protein D
VKKGEVSFNFDDADIFSVIQTIFGDILRVNYLVDPSVKGRVNFRSVAPVAKDDVLPLMEVILRLNGIGIVEEGGLYRIVPIADIAKEPAPVGIGRDPEKVKITGKAVLQVVPVNYVQSADIVKLLTPFLSKNAVLLDVPKSNYIVVVDTDTNVKRLLQLIEVFDSEQLKKIKPEVYVYPVQNGKAKDIAAMLQQIFLGGKGGAPGTKPTTPARPQPGAPGQPAQPTPAPTPQATSIPEGEALVAETTRIFPDEVTNSLIILATPDDYELISETIQKIDVVPRQVVIEGIIARVDLIDNLSFGFSWSFLSDVRIGDVVDLAGNFALGSDFAISSGQTFTFVGVDPSGIVRAKLTAALQESKARILASPYILVSDNREARIQVGQQVPLATSTTTTPIGGTIPTNTSTSTVQYKDIGIILRVKPQVNDGGLVSLEITQEVSNLGDNVSVGGVDFASINKTEATTNLVVQDGQTILIGGLIREDTVKGKTGIPFLSNIPIIGNLFSSVRDNTTRNELVILLTPHVLRTPKDSTRATSAYVDEFQRATQDKTIGDFLKFRKEQQAVKGQSAPPPPPPR